LSEYGKPSYNQYTPKESVKPAGWCGCFESYAEPCCSLHSVHWIIWWGRMPVWSVPIRVGHLASTAQQGKFGPGALGGLPAIVSISCLKMCCGLVGNTCPCTCAPGGFGLLASLRCGCVSLGINDGMCNSLLRGRVRQIAVT
jgi:hypothetical protein